jgi:hypothetical protein
LHKPDCISLIAIAVPFGASSTQNCRGGGNGDGHSGGKPGVRALATTSNQISLKAICANILEGYEHGLEAPEAFVLDRQHMWLRTRFVVGDTERAMFWQKIENQYHDLLAKKKAEQPPARWLKLFAAALPDPSITLAHWRRSAGTSNLGRPRWIGYGT